MTTGFCEEKMTDVHGLSEKKFEALIGVLLRTGVVLAATVVLVGGVFYLTKYGGLKPDYRIFRGEPSDLRSIEGVVGDTISLHSRGIIQLGLLLLIATPIARVAFSVAGFASERDWLYVGITLVVLGVLIYSLLSS
jgi:uncharacterized membrane protein